MEHKRKVLTASELGIAFQVAADVPRLLEACFDSDGLIISENDLPPAFFDLKTGLAGELLQKFVNHRVRVAVVVRKPAAYGNRFNELSNEHASHAIVRFVRSEADAHNWLNT
jgi:hypothetical protein